MRGRVRGVAWICLLSAGLACGHEEDGAAAEPVAESAPAPILTVPAGTPLPALVQRPGGAPVRQPPLPEPRVAFQPAFHQALRFSRSTDGLTTFRLRVPVGRTGGRLRLAFRAGDGSLTLQKATVARAGSAGALASAPLTVSFSGAPGFSAGARQRVVSDPVSLPVAAGDELAVSFEVDGALSAAADNALSLPGSFRRAGAHASRPDALGGTAWSQSMGLATVEVEGPASLAFVAIGDSITEGYISGRDDTRLAWPFVAQRELGLPFANAGVGGQGLFEYSRSGSSPELEREVLALDDSGALVTDCVVLLGTNDLGAEGMTVARLQQRLTTVFGRLRPLCRVWAGTLLPKDHTNHGDYEQVKVQRLALNDWLRTRADVFGVIDFEAVTRSAGSPHLFRAGLEGDGIHPSREGQRVMGLEAARVLRERLLPAEP